MANLTIDSAMGGVKNLGMEGIRPNRPEVHGRGKEVAETFEKASHFAQGYQPSADVAQIGLQSVLERYGASDAEKLVADAVLKQAAQVESALTQGAMKDSGQGSRYCMLTQGLGYIAAGGAANGPIGVVLADLGNRQMDSTRAQSFNTASASDVRDSNVVGVGMLNQVIQNVDDPNIQFIAGQALSQLGNRYYKSEKCGRIEQDREVLYRDANTLHQTFDAIKMVAGLGDPGNPKIMAMMEGNLPPTPTASGSYSVGRPDGGYAEYRSPGDGFGVTRGPRPMDL